MWFCEVEYDRRWSCEFIIVEGIDYTIWIFYVTFFVDYATFWDRLQTGIQSPRALNRPD